MPSNSKSTSGEERTQTVSVWGNVGRFLIAFVPSIYLLCRFYPEIGEDLLGIAVSTPAVSEDARASLSLVEWLERLPLSPTFYFLVTVSAGICFCWRRCSYAKLSREIKDAASIEGTSSLTNHDWGVIRGLRNRAFHLRTRAGVMLTGLIFLLFGAIYLVLFILPQVRGRDRVLIEETIFRERYGHILRLMSQGGYWLKMDAKGLDLAHGEKIITASFAPDGRRGVAGSSTSSVFFTTDGGWTWSRPAGLTLKRSEREYAYKMNFGVNDDSKTMLVLSTKRSVFVTRDEARTLIQPHGLEGKEIARVRLTPDGRRGIAGGFMSSVFFTTDGGWTWSHLTNLPLEESERKHVVAMVGFGVKDDSETMLVVGHEGSAFVTKDKGRTWKSLKKRDKEQNKEQNEEQNKGLDLEGGETILTMEFAPDGQRGIAGSNMSAVFLTTDGGWEWSRLTNLPLKKSGEYVARVQFDVNDDPRTILVVGSEGSVFVTRDGGETWTRPDRIEGKGIRPTTVRFAPDRRRGIAGSTTNSVFFTKDGGVTWRRLTDLTSKGSERESVAMVQFGVNGDPEAMIVVGADGSVFVTRDEGKTWSRTEGLGSVTKELVSVQAIQENPTKKILIDEQNGDGSPSEEKDGPQYSFLMMAGDGAYILKSHPIGPEQSLSLIQSNVEENDMLRRSVIGKDILTALQKLPKDGEGPALIDLTLMRIATMTIVFFLVQLLVRLYQYNLRLASFLDSRADAVLLARTFASGDGSIPFDDLVRSMAPDDYDFKPQPGLLPGMLKQFLSQRNPQATKSD